MKLTDKKSLHSNAYIIATIVFALFSFIMLPVKNGFILRWIDEMSLFEPGEIFFNRLAHYPGGILQWAGTWLTQLMYYPWLGSSVLISLWVAMSYAAKKAFKLDSNSGVLGLLPGMFLLMSVVSLDDAWISLCYKGYVFAPTLGVIIALLMTWGLKSITKRWVRCLAATLSAFTYAWLGCYPLLAIVLYAVWETAGIVREKDFKSLWSPLIPLAALAVSPTIYYYFYPGNTVDNDFLLLKGVPDFMMEGYDLYLWIPFILTGISLLGLALLEVINKSGHIKSMKLVAAIYLIAGCVTYTANNKSEQFRATVLMLQYLDGMNLNSMVNIMHRTRETPSFPMKVLENLALIKLGSGQDNVSMPKGGTDAERNNPRKSDEFLMTAHINVPVYYHLGKTRSSYRWCMEHTVKYGHRAFFIKYMVRNSIVNGELELASRYNRLLLNTMFHRKWAERFQRYIDNPDLIKESPEFMSIPDNPTETIFISN